MVKKTYIEPQSKTYNISINTVLAGSPEAQVGDGNANEKYGVDSKGANINWEGGDE